jgi:hypothetical protein
MNLRLLLSVFGRCSHRNETWPMKPRNRAGRVMRTEPSYRVCLDCGREREYTLLEAQPPRPRPLGIPQREKAT